MTANADQIEYWNEIVGPRWVEAQERLDLTMAPLSEALLEVAVPTRGDFVLDVGCGCGDLALRLAAMVGAAGRVRGIDISKPMLARAAARLAETRPAGPVELLEIDAMTGTFEADNDLLISRFGVMFFEDRALAFANLRRTLKPGGRFAFLAWRGRDEIDWFRKPLEWIAPVLPTPENTDGEVGPFGLADGEATRELLEDAGFWDVRPDPIDRELTIAETLDDAFAMLTDFGPAAALMRNANPDDRARAETLMREGIEREAKNGRLSLRGSAWIFRGTAGGLHAP